MADELVRLTDVYGISRDVPANYTPRDNMDGLLVDSLTQDKHIVIYGSSKQGKTCLRKWNLHEGDYLVVTCSNKWDLAQLHGAILKAAGFSVEQTATRTIKGANKVVAKFTAKMRLGFVSGGPEAGGEHARETQDSVVRAPLELDLIDVNDIILALTSAEFNGYVVLEDFHYLPEETQRDFAIVLKAFHESSKYCFIVVGVWLDENRLIQFNGDLTGRVIAINADAWTDQQLHEVITRGEHLLNIQFDSGFRKLLIAACFESVWVVQDTCYRACERSGVYFRQEQLRTVGANQDVFAIIRDVVDTQSARYNTFISSFSAGFMETALNMYRWLLLPVLLAEPNQLEAGILYGELRRLINNYHPESPINAGNLTQALKSTAPLQVRLNITPIILDYNQSRRRLDVVDRSFLVWLKHQDVTELLSIAQFPEGVVRSSSVHGL